MKISKSLPQNYNISAPFKNKIVLVLCYNFHFAKKFISNHINISHPFVIYILIYHIRPIYQRVDIE